MLRAMDRRQHNEYAIQASFHGLKIPLRHNHERAVEEQKVNFDPKEEERALAALMQAQKRVKARYG